MEKEYARFRKKVRKLKSGCWKWKASLIKGYGQFRFAGRRSGRAHRFSYIYFKGPVPEGKVIDHRCNNTWCVNPKHLRAVTVAFNTLRGSGPTAVNARKTTCVWGHPLKGSNLWLRPYKAKGKSYEERVCRTCRRHWTQEWKKRAAALNVIRGKDETV